MKSWRVVYRTNDFIKSTTVRAHLQLQDGCLVFKNEKSEYVQLFGRNQWITVQESD